VLLETISSSLELPQMLPVLHLELSCVNIKSLKVEIVADQTSVTEDKSLWSGGVKPEPQSPKWPITGSLSERPLPNLPRPTYLIFDIETTPHSDVFGASRPNLLRTMISRSAIGQNAQLALRRQCCAQPASRRGFVAAVSGSTSFSYESADVGGVKVASRDVTGPTTKLAVVAKAGTRYQSLPGLTSALEQFAFKVRTCRSSSHQAQ